MSRVRNPTGKLERQMVKGAAPPSAAVIGELELQKWKNIITKEDEQRLIEDNKLRSTKHDVSNQRRAGWSNTVEGMHKAKDEARKRRLEEEEARRLLIDEEEEALKKAERRVVVDDANRQLHARDQRVLKLNSQLLLHDVLHEREEQLVLSARKKQQVKDREKEYADSVIRAAKQEELEKQADAIKARQKLVALSLDRVKQLEDQKSARVSEVKSAREEGQRLRELAEEDARESVNNRLSARAKAKAVAIDHENQLKEKAARTPRKTDGVAQSDPGMDEKNEQYLTKKAEQHMQYEECLTARRARKDVARQQALDVFQSPTKRTDEATATLLSARSLENKMLEDDFIRSDFKEHSRKLAASLDAQLTVKREAKQRAEDAKEKNMQAKLASRLASLELEDKEAKIQARQDALRLQHFQKLQANEKRYNNESYQYGLVEEGQSMKCMESEENEMFASYVESMIPTNMNPTLKQQATKSPRSLKMSVA